MRPSFYKDPSYRRRQSNIAKHYLKLHPRIKISITRNCKNPNCNLPFQIKPSYPKIYCGSSCAAIVNNSRRPKTVYYCAGCNQQIYRADRKYCSVKCQQHCYYKQYISEWKQGLVDGNRGITTKTLSGYIRRYLFEKYGEKCCSCGWNQKNKITGKVPVEVDHIDGNSENNKEENLRLICPNCHSLTPCFRNLNKGKGRSWRLKYLKKNRAYL